MIDEPRVWIRKRPCKSGKVTYHLRWVCPTTGKWKNRKVGTDRRYADRGAALLEHELAEGTYRDVKRISWTAFVEDHVAKIAGRANAREAERTLNEFGKMYDVEPRRVTYVMIESYVAWLRELIPERSRSKEHQPEKRPRNAQSTINKKLRYLRAAFNAAVKRGYVAKNPMNGWQWVREDEKPPRIATETEEKKLLDKADTLYGFPLKAFVYVALNTGGRREELLTLSWDRIDLDAPRVHFAHTKGKRDRFVPVNPEVVDVLRRLQVRTLRDDGPFVSLRDNLGRMWGRVVRKAEVAPISIHDLRRTYVTRLIRAGVPLPTVQKLAGHRDIKTTLKYYNWVSDEDLRGGVARLRRRA